MGKWMGLVTRKSGMGRDLLRSLVTSTLWTSSHTYGQSGRRGGCVINNSICYFTVQNVCIKTKRGNKIK